MYFHFTQEWVEGVLSFLASLYATIGLLQQFHPGSSCWIKESLQFSTDISSDVHFSDYSGLKFWESPVRNFRQNTQSYTCHVLLVFSEIAAEKTFSLWSSKSVPGVPVGWGFLNNRTILCLIPTECYGTASCRSLHCYAFFRCKSFFEKRKMSCACFGQEQDILGHPIVPEIVGFTGQAW